MSKEIDTDSFMEKMKDVLFDSHEEREDGMIEAEVNEEIHNMIIEKVPQNKSLNQSEYQAILIKVSMEVANYLLERIDDLPKSLASSFAFDFVSQLLMSASSVVTEKDDKYDPMWS